MGAPFRELETWIFVAARFASGIASAQSAPALASGRFEKPSHRQEYVFGSALIKG
jgi:hypothetical protein